MYKLLTYSNFCEGLIKYIILALGRVGLFFTLLAAENNVLNTILASMMDSQKIS